MSSNVTYREATPGGGVDPNHPAEAGYRVEVVDGPNGITRATPEPRLKIAIVGFAASSRTLAPFDDGSYEIWGLNQLYRHIPRASRWFDIHANWREDNVDGTDHPKWLAECGVPVYMSSFQPELPTCVNYPLERIIEKVTGVDYFTSTVAYMVALAIYEIDQQVEAELAGAKFDSAVEYKKALADAYEKREIAIFGIDLIVGTEYDWQKSCVEFLLGLAQNRGITLRLPKVCALLKQRWRYGYQTEAPSFPIRHSEIKARQAALLKERNETISKLQALDGALQENGYWDQISELRIKGGEVMTNEEAAKK